MVVVVVVVAEEVAGAVAVTVAVVAVAMAAAVVVGMVAAAAAGETAAEEQFKCFENGFRLHVQSLKGVLRAIPHVDAQFHKHAHETHVSHSGDIIAHQNQPIPM